ncbi:c-type cytochrome [Thermosulfurimonas marina]|uniref:C-type cytochrome n=1 Tax=Thermosulfurimonas marina TaxID=2047767 RepID=A0A6H1WUD1_9BACT|nr:c-type cytochrome [Thermosulfurimonas marina]QJA06759.1 c-type cytochrome [Thermosulfurimonas marina]
MKRFLGAGLLATLVIVSPGFCGGGKPDGKALFSRNCGFCHPGGRNVIHPKKTLDRETLLKNGIQGPEGIVEKMRNPGPGMPRFSEKRLSDEEARAIAEYVWETFKKK